jgi:exosortase/archaeosortase family protein
VYKLFLDKYFSLTVRLILGKALLFFVMWKFVFLFFLRESKVIDYPLTAHIGEYSTLLLNTLVAPPNFTVNREFRQSIRAGTVFKYEVSQVYYNNKKVVYVADGCNALELMVGFIGFIFCLPSRFWRKVRYIIFGLIIIHSINIVRCSGLTYVNLYHQPYFHQAHFYWFKGAMYSIVFILWMLYLRKVQFKFNYGVPKTHAGIV